MTPSVLKALISAVPGGHALRRSRYWRYFTQATNANLFYGIYRSFAEARAAAPQSKPLGYDHDEAATMYRPLMEQVFPSDYPVLYWLGHWSQAVHAVFDLGGHVGIKYYAFSPRLPFGPQLRWTVFDVPRVVQQGETLATARGEARLRFTASFGELDRGFDALLALGSLQYLEDSLAQRLSTLRRKPQRLLINTTPMTEGAEFFTLQNIGSSFCPYKIQSRAELITSLERLGYRLLDEWTNPDKSCPIPFFDSGAPVVYRGMALELPPEAA